MQIGPVFRRAPVSPAFGRLAITPASSEFAPASRFTLASRLSRATRIASRVAIAITLASGLAVVGSTVAGCGGSQEAKSANVKPDDMPSGETWTGVYFHPVYGYLHMVEQDTNVVAKWKRTDQSAWGELSGVKTGNVVHFTWHEHKYGLVGPSAETHGKGYFVYKMNGESIAELDGQFGLENDETGSDWHNVKQQRMVPDLNSIKGDTGGLSPSAGEQWK